MTPSGEPPEVYPPRCSQCGQRWIDMPCGPTHAVVADRLGLNDLGMDRVAAAEAVAALDAIDADDVQPGHDPENFHLAADGILLECVPSEVAAAHHRLVDRCSWWAHA